MSKEGRNKGTVVKNPSVSLNSISSTLFPKYQNELKGHIFKDTETYIEPVEIGFSQDRVNKRVISCIANMIKIDLKEESIEHDIISMYSGSDCKDNLVTVLKENEYPLNQCS